MDNYQVTSRWGSEIFMFAEPDFSAVHSLGASSDPRDGSPDDWFSFFLPYHVRSEIEFWS
jgi:hypothetical protein